MNMFLKVFNSQATDLLIRLKNSIVDLQTLQTDIERLVIMEQNSANTAKPIESIVSTIRDSLGVALWIKDMNHRIIFANKVYCDTILKCSENELKYLTKEEVGKDPLYQQCVKSDKLVMTNKRTMRFIEHAVYKDKSTIFVDVVKSPRIEGGEIVGIVGSGVIITDRIPKGIRDQNRSSHSIEIPVNASMGPITFIGLLERRKGSRQSSDDKVYKRRRSKKKGQ